MIGLIFCAIVINGELLALTAALIGAAVISLNFVGGAINILGDAIITAGASVALVGAVGAAGPAALAILLALGLTVPITLHIPI